MENKISRRTVWRWLREWDYVVNGGAPSEYVISGNSGCKPVDGVTARQLNKIMLEDAYNHLPSDLRRVVYSRWIQPTTLNETLTELGYSKDQYYYRCEKAVTFIFHYVNGESFVD